MTNAFAKAWSLLKALPEHQMFVERSPRENVVDDYQYDYEDKPEIDRYGARSLGTVHPAILGMLQRRTDDYHQTEGISPNLNLDLGREADRRIEENKRVFGEDYESHEDGMSIGQGPEFNRRMNDQWTDYVEYPTRDEHHDPNKAARRGPFDDSRHASGHTNPERFMTGYGYSPSHKLTHPKMGEYD